MAAYPIKSLELYYTMIQFLIIKYINRNGVHKIWPRFSIVVFDNYYFIEVNIHRNSQHITL